MNLAAARAMRPGRKRDAAVAAAEVELTRAEEEQTRISDAKAEGGAKSGAS